MSVSRKLAPHFISPYKINTVISPSAVCLNSTLPGLTVRWPQVTTECSTDTTGPYQSWAHPTHCPTSFSNPGQSVPRIKGCARWERITTLTLCFALFLILADTIKISVNVTVYILNLHPWTMPLGWTRIWWTRICVASLCCVVANKKAWKAITDIKIFIQHYVMGKTLGPRGPKGGSSRKVAGKWGW